MAIVNAPMTTIGTILVIIMYIESHTPLYIISCPDVSISNQALTFEFPRVITRINVTFFIDSYQSTTISIFWITFPYIKNLV